MRFLNISLVISKHRSADWRERLTTSRSFLKRLGTKKQIINIKKINIIDTSRWGLKCLLILFVTYAPNRNDTFSEIIAEIWLENLLFVEIKNIFNIVYLF